MGIIKLFEEFSDVQFEEIAYHDFSFTIRNSEYITFTKKEEVELSKYGTVRVNINNISINTPQFNINIYKLPDEWYYISVGLRYYYKCDGFEGVKEFLDYIL